MTHEFRNERRQLVILADEEDRRELRELRDDDPDRWGTEQLEIEQLEHLLANSELDWVDPVDTGDLTDAPLLGITGGDDDEIRTKTGPHGARHGGGDEKGPIYYPITERWGFMDYQIKTFLEDLLEKGEAVFLDRY